MTRSISDVERRVRLSSRHLLIAAEPPVAVLEPPALTIAGAIVALHSSDPATVYLSVLARSASSTIDSVSRTLYEDRLVVRVHGMRRTLWVADVEVASDIVAASATRLVGAERRRLATLLAAAGIDDPESWIDDAVDEVASFVIASGTTDTRAVGAALPHLAIDLEVASGKSYAGTITAHTRILLMLGFQGRIVRAAPRGTWIASQYQWAAAEEWIAGGLSTGSSGNDGAPAQAPARTAIIARYLRAFGPVTTEDVVWWTGWPKGAVLKALSEIGAVEVVIDEGSGWLHPEDDLGITDARRLDSDDPSAQVAVLPGLDPTTMGWKRRAWYLDSSITGLLFDRNGNGGPTIWVGGRIVGGWAQRDDGELAYRLLVDVGREAEGVIEQRLNDLATRLGDSRFKVRFPNPLNSELRR